MFLFSFLNSNKSKQYMYYYSHSLYIFYYNLTSYSHKTDKIVYNAKTDNHSPGPVARFIQASLCKIQGLLKTFLLFSRSENLYKILIYMYQNTTSEMLDCFT